LFRFWSRSSESKEPGLTLPETAPGACLLALLIGVVAGLRTMTAPAAVSWAAHVGWLDLRGSWLAFMGYAWTPWIVSVLALLEFVADQLPSTPSRTVPMQFCARIVSGALAGAAIGTAGGVLAAGLIAGMAGATIGTLGGRAVRAWLAAAFGNDRPAAFVEDAVAIGSSLLIVAALR
jgi:uncharacterized membrane protein